MKLLYVLLGVSTIVLIGSILYLVNLNNQIKPPTNIKTPEPVTQQMPGRLKEDELRKNYPSFISEDSKINMTFFGKVYEISTSSVTLIDNNKNKITLSNDNNKPITQIYEYNTKEKIKMTPINSEDIIIGDLVNVSISIFNLSDKINIDGIYKLKSN